MKFKTATFSLILTIPILIIGVFLFETRYSFKSPVSYIYVAEHKEFHPFMPEEDGIIGRIVLSFIIDAEGDAQYIKREADSAVHSLRKGEIEFTRLKDTLLDNWPKNEYWKEKKDPILDLFEEATLHDHPGFFRVIVAVRGEQVRFWEGPEEDMPAPWREIIEETRKYLVTIEEHKEEEVVAWLHTILFTPEKAREKIRAGVVDPIEDEDISRSPQLQEALLNPFKIFPIYENENPFTPLSWSGYTPGRSAANVSWRGGVFQVRPMLNEVGKD